MSQQTLRLNQRQQRIMRHFRSCLNALRLGFVYVRARWFKMPDKIRVAGKVVSLDYPHDHGASTDFIACCIRNDYGLREQLSNIKTILDIGANVGFFSVAARACYPRATIHAYEPNPRVLPFLQANTAQLNMTVYPEAVGAESGHVSILDSEDSNQARTQASAAGTIPQVSLSRAVERLGGMVDLLKLDCEGAEWEMFRARAPWRKIRSIRMEYHLVGGRTIEDVEQNLRDLGFEPTHWEPDAGFGIVWAASTAQQ